MNDSTTYFELGMSESFEMTDVVFQQMPEPFRKLGHFPGLTHVKLAQQRQEDEHQRMRF